MIKNHKRNLLLSSLVILLPIVAGLILWNRLPEKIATHWGPTGQPDGWSNRALAVWGLPLFLLVLHWFCVFITTKDPKNKEQHHKLFQLTFWICPVISLLGGLLIYATALGFTIPMSTVAALLVGLGFVFIGNYLPKCKQNYTIGIKITWTLASEENWNATHRVAGRVWFIGGLVMMASALLPEHLVFLVPLILLPVLALVPVIYSYLYYKRHG